MLGNHSCKTKERQKESFPLPVPCYSKPKKSPEEHLHDLTYKCTSKPGTAHSLPAMKTGSSKTEKQNISHALLTLQSPVLLTDLWQVINTKQPPATRLTFVTCTSCLYIFIQENYAFTMKFSMVWAWKETGAMWRVREDKSHHSAKSRCFRSSSQGRQRSKNPNTKRGHSAKWLSPRQLQIKPAGLQSRTSNSEKYDLKMQQVHKQTVSQ